MKKIFVLVVAVALTGCAELSDFLSTGGSNASDSTRAKMQNCMLSDAQSRLQAGTLFNDTIYNTAKDLAATCTKKLALESMGISQQAQSDATNIINSLRNLANN